MKERTSLLLKKIKTLPVKPERSSKSVQFIVDEIKKTSEFKITAV